MLYYYDLLMLFIVNMSVIIYNFMFKKLPFQDTPNNKSLSAALKKLWKRVCMQIFAIFISHKKSDTFINCVFQLCF